MNLMRVFSKTEAESCVKSSFDTLTLGCLVTQTSHGSYKQYSAEDQGGYSYVMFKDKTMCGIEVSGASGNAICRVFLKQVGKNFVLDQVLGVADGIGLLRAIERYFE
jgi:hypothetical protein